MTVLAYSYLGKLFSLYSTNPFIRLVCGIANGIVTHIDQATDS